MKLNARQVEAAKPKDNTYKMADGGGLYHSALRAMGYDTKTEVYGHGFRTMARGALG